MKTYSEKLRDPKWQKKRLEILQRDEFCCQLCNDKETELHIHHYYYNSNLPWECDDLSMITLCKYCHWIEENYNKNKYTIIKTIKNQNLFLCHALDNFSHKTIILFYVNEDKEIYPLFEANQDSYDILKEFIIQSELFFNL
jgi:hypothetical protein